VKKSSLPWVGLRPVRPGLLIRQKRRRTWLVNAVMPVNPGHSNNAPDPLVVPQLPIGRFWGTLALTAVAAAG